MVLVVPLHCDSHVTIAKAKSENYNEERRQIRIRCNSIKKLLAHGVISLGIFIFEKNIVDLLTKGLVCGELSNH